MQFSFTRRERRDLLKSWAAISVAFAIVEAGSILAGWRSLAAALALSAVTVGIGFLLHELAHKYMAQRYGCYAEFRSDDPMLVLAILTSLLGIVIAAPGAVHISGHSDEQERGKTALAGPLMNLVLALAFLGMFYFTAGWLHRAAGFGMVINTWLALFNMIPFGAFDGAKVFSWNKAAYGILVGAAIILSLLQIPLGLLGV